MIRLHTKLKDEKGIALLISVILMLLISAIGIAALQHAREESSGSGRSRHHTKNLHAADGMLQLVVQQLAAENPASREAPVDFANFIQDPLSGSWMKLAKSTGSCRLTGFSAASCWTTSCSTPSAACRFLV